jgi:hypothetical protein
MKSLKLMKLVLGTLLAVLATTAQSQKWDPTAPSTNNAANLANAASVLYLDDSCNVVAWVIDLPSPQYYVFPTRNDRLPTAFSPTYQHAGACPGKFLDAALVGAGDPDACKTDSTAVTIIGNERCRISRDLVTSIIVLDQALQPLLIVEGQLANDSAPGVVPARILGRKDPVGGHPCPNPIPPPCSPQPPHASTLMNLNGVLTCVCFK